MKTIFSDGILEAVFYPDKQWVFCRWLQNGRGKLQKQLIRDIRFIEDIITVNGWHGWFTLSELAHKEFHKLLEKFGCEAAQIEGNFQYFIKPILKEGSSHAL
jgi:hypothetical protein